MRVIEKDGAKLALHFTMDDIGPGLSFLTDDADLLQVGAWRYGAGKELACHNHNIVERGVNRTQEFVFVVRGSLKATVHDERDNLVDELVVAAREGLILFAGGHGYTILEEDTVVIETKNGPYPGAEADRRRF